MAHPLTQVIDYISYQHGRGVEFAYHDFEAEGIKRPKAVRTSVIFPEGWTDERRRKWRARNKLAIPGGKPVDVIADLRRDFTRTGEFV